MATSEKKRYQKYERFYLRGNKISAELHGLFTKICTPN